jgi:hypothetical protein
VVGEAKDGREPVALTPAVDIDVVMSWLKTQIGSLSSASVSGPAAPPAFPYARPCTGFSRAVSLPIVLTLLTSASLGASLSGRTTAEMELAYRQARSQ